MIATDMLRLVLDFTIPVATAVVGYLVGGKKRNNDFLGDLQRSIDLLSTRNGELMQELISLRGEMVELKSENAELKLEVSKLRSENSKLLDEVGQLRSQLEGVKTITRVK